MSEITNSEYPQLKNKEIPKYYICIHCNKIYMNVVQADCGCRYCSRCLDEILKQSTKCKNCGDEVPDIKMPDKAFHKELSIFIAECDQCEWTGKLCEYRAHYDDKHPRVPCEYCKETFKDTNSLNEHLNNDKCKLKPKECPFSNYGCTETVNNSILNQHLNLNHIVQILINLHGRVDQIQKDINENKNNVENRFSQNESHINKCVNEIQEHMNTNDNNEKRLSQIESFNSKLIDSINTTASAINTLPLNTASNANHAIVTCSECGKWQGKYIEFPLHYNKVHV